MTNKTTAIKAACWCLEAALQHLERCHVDEDKKHIREFHARRLQYLCGDGGVVHTIGELRAAIWMALDGQKEDDEIRNTIATELGRFHPSVRVFNGNGPKIEVA